MIGEFIDQHVVNKLPDRWKVQGSGHANIPLWRHDVRPHLPRQRNRRHVRDGVDDAIKGAISRASETLRGLDWFEVTEIRGHIVDGAMGHVQVGLKVGFRLDA